jgi:ElaB/YqjD/DUF883 family membrane-anchored ribosome-binding protein
LRAHGVHHAFIEEEIVMQETMRTGSAPEGFSTGGMSERAHAGIDRVSSGAHDTVDRVASAASSAADRIGAQSDQWLEAKERWVETTRGYVREHPLAALGVALAAGFLLSRLSR